MDRSQSEDHIAFGLDTPWQTDTFPQLPRRGKSEPRLPGTEKPRPSRSNSVKAPRPAKRSVTQRSDPSQYRGTPPPENSTRLLRAQGSLSAEPSPRPYETPTFSPEALRAAPSPPPCYTKALPLTSPDSFTDEKKSRSSSTDKSVSPSSKQVVHVLPGTMSARNGRSRASSRQRGERSRGGKKKKPATGVRRWKVAFREIFTKNPVDETQFERIEDRHWTDE